MSMYLKEMPLINGLKTYIDEQNGIYHMPGHKQGRGFPQLFHDLLIEMDVTEVDGTDNLAHPTGIIADAQRCAARAFGSRHTFFLTQGATIGNHAMILATCRPGHKLMVPRNVHVSVINAMMLYGVEPVWIPSKFNKKTERLSPVSVEMVQTALQQDKTVKGALITTPTYFGEVSPLRDIAELLHQQGKILLVDQAHGSHFPFSKRLPDDAGTCGADMWVHSAHKTLPALTQAAYLHSSNDQLEQSINQAIHLLHSSSPSYMLMASLDYARAFMEHQGDKAFEHLYATVTSWQEHMHNGTMVKVENFGRQRDFSRIVLDVKAMGWQGAQWQRYLRKKGIQCEMADFRYCVLISTVFDEPHWLDKIVEIAQKTPRRENHQQTNRYDLIQEAINHVPLKAMTFSDVFQADKEAAQLRLAGNRVCAQAIGLYPPGIPLVCPGEMITKEMIELIKTAKEIGIDVFGLENGTAMVVKDRTRR